MIEKNLQYALGKFAIETKKELETKILAITQENIANAISAAESRSDTKLKEMLRVVMSVE